VVTSAENIPMTNTTDLLRTRALYLLLFLFPLFGNSINHWFGAIFFIIFLISLPCLFNKMDNPLYPEERLMLYFLAAFFATFILSALVNGWAEWQTRSLGVEIRYLAAVPVYLLLRRFPDAARWLLTGSVLAAIIIAANAYCDVFVLNKARAWGAYSPNLIGPFAALIAVWSLVMWQTGRTPCRISRWWLPLFSLIALFAVVLSGSRGAYVGLIAMLLVWIVLSLQRWYRFAAILSMVLMLLFSYFFVDSVKVRVDGAVAEIETYLAIDDIAAHQGELIGNAQRLEIWRTAVLIFKQAPFIGVGRGNFEQVAAEHAGKGLVHVSGVQAGHAHNAYLDVLSSRGIVGFVVFMGMLLYPLYFFFSTRTVSPDSAMLGMIHIIGFMTFSITDASTFVKGNFASIFLLYLAAFFSWHVRRVRGTKSD